MQRQTRTSSGSGNSCHRRPNSAPALDLQGFGVNARLNLQGCLPNDRAFVNLQIAQGVVDCFGRQVGAELADQPVVWRRGHLDLGGTGDCRLLSDGVGVPGGAIVAVTCKSVPGCPWSPGVNCELTDTTDSGPLAPARPASPMDFSGCPLRMFSCPQAGAVAINRIATVNATLRGAAATHHVNALYPYALTY